MSQGTQVNQAVVRRRLQMLEDLAAIVERQFSPMDSVISRQSTAMWTDIPTCSGFASGYSRTLFDVQQGLLGLRGQLVGLHEALAESVRSLERVDQDIQDRLGALATRLVDPIVLRSERYVDTTTPTTNPATTPASAPAGDPQPAGEDW